MSRKAEARQIALQWALLAHGTDITKSAAGQQKILQTAADFERVAQAFLMSIDNATALAEHNTQLMQINNTLTAYLADIGRTLQAMMPQEMSQAFSAMMQKASSPARSARIQKALRRGRAEQAAEQADHFIDPSGQALQRRYGTRASAPWSSTGINGWVSYKGHEMARKDLDDDTGPDVPPHHPEAKP